MKYIVDTDPGVDDALALLYLSQLEEPEIKGITVAPGNSTQRNCLKNANMVKDLAGIDSPVYRGSSKPLNKKLETADSHGESGLGNLNPSDQYLRSDGDAVEQILENAGEDNRLVTLGPLTNIAKAVKRDKDILEKFDSVTIMGGAINTYGNINRVAEFNFYVDPEAAEKVVQAPGEKHLVPVNTCRNTVITEEALKSLKDSDWFEKLVKPYLNYYKKRKGFNGAILYDPLTVISAVNNIGGTEPMDIKIETNGKYTRGMTIPERRPQKKNEPNLSVLKSIDEENVVEKFVDAFKN